jgi:hypothetical protein
MSIILPTVNTVSNPQGWGYDAHVDELLLRLAVSPKDLMQRVTADATPQRVDTAESAQDIKDETGVRYSRTNLSGGAGLDFLHSAQRPDDAANRFWSSRGIDVFSDNPGEPYSARLLHAMALSQSSGATNVWVASVNDVPYWSNGTAIYEHSTLRESIALTQMVAMGNDLYGLASTGVIRTTPGLWSNSVIDSTITYQKIWGIKARILAVDDNVLYQTDPTTPTPVLTLPDNDTVTDVIDAGAYILVLTTTGDIYTLTLDDSLAIVPIGTSPFIGEIPHRGAYSQDVLGIVTEQSVPAGGTILRFYAGTLSDQGTPQNMQLVYQLGSEEETIDFTADAVFASRDSLYVLTQSELETNVSNLWRYYLPTRGYARDMEIPTAGGGQSSGVYAAGRIYLGVSTKGLYAEQATYVTSGYCIGPAADFATSDPKQWVSAYLQGMEIPTGCTMQLYESTILEDLQDPNSATWLEVLTMVNATGLEKESVTTPAGNAVYHMGKFVLYANGDQSESPSFRSYSFRALPTPDRDVLIRIPVNVSDQYESPGKRAATVLGRGKAILDALLRYEGRNVNFGIYRTGFDFIGVVERIETASPALLQRGSPFAVAFMLIRGKETTVSTGYGTETSNAGWGIDPWAISAWAIGEADS